MFNCALFGYGRAGQIHFKNILNKHGTLPSSSIKTKIDSAQKIDLNYF